MTRMNRGAVEWSRKVVWIWSKQFWKGLGHAFQKIYTLWGLSLVDFCENGKTQIFSGIKHLTNGINFDLKNDIQKRIFQNTKRLFFVLCDPKWSHFISIITMKVVPYDQSFRLVVIKEPQNISKILYGRKSKKWDFHKELMGRLQMPSKSGWSGNEDFYIKLKFF